MNKPKTEQSAAKKISLAIQPDLVAGLEVAAVLHKGSVTAYINELIRKDIEQNADSYKKLAKMVEKMRG